MFSGNKNKACPRIYLKTLLQQIQCHRLRWIKTMYNVHNVQSTVVDCVQSTSSLVTWNTVSEIRRNVRIMDLQSPPPPQYCRWPICCHRFSSPKYVFSWVYDSLYCRFPIPPFFCQAWERRYCHWGCRLYFHASDSQNTDKQDWNATRV